MTQVISEEERKKRQALSRALNDAFARGDMETYDALMREIEAPAEALMAAKKSMGADWVRKKGFNTKRADEKYGPGWLDR
ncbi:hypothetical protein HH303_03935 [Rhodospirillaceae bacterium KN72]|uniref:Uncharacterized protein n=1 Tax=Pacificispira spongiicola TaxID=2729598 RepID=A0A7Y0HFT0_9PROT|nr:hypothetical protein [Pacificispira spongiicola]NMM43614.1 hypothetical protein [Pacificispira spongiicola]